MEDTENAVSVLVRDRNIGSRKRQSKESRSSLRKKKQWKRRASFQRYDCRKELNVEEKETTPATEEVETNVKEVLSAETHTKMEMNDQFVMLLDYMQGVKQEQRNMNEELKEEQKRMGTKIEEKVEEQDRKMDQKFIKLTNKLEEQAQEVEEIKKNQNKMKTIIM
ncbi:unnamed protein product [Psylliodes chrysocephalus]|uniref:Uncharacterized protein n=1 Tax=Psylliodes chrysocephalus TaxID=3402493 RepID=A0A9P0CVP1_9CUCU|nr:unnamed protein product [Psylliodes chrysocephala]